MDTLREIIVGVGDGYCEQSGSGGSALGSISGHGRPSVVTMIGNTEGRGGRWGKGGDPLHGQWPIELKPLTWVEVWTGGRRPNPHNCVNLGDGGRGSIPVCWVAPTLYSKFLPFPPNNLITSYQERQQQLHEWRENSPLATRMTRKIYQPSEHEGRERWDTRDEGVKRYVSSILTKSGTTYTLENGKSVTNHPSRYKICPPPIYLPKELQWLSVPFTTLCTLAELNIAITTITDDWHHVNINQCHPSSSRQWHGFWSFLNNYHCHYKLWLHPSGSQHCPSHHHYPGHPHYSHDHHDHNHQNCSHHLHSYSVYPLLGYQ